MGLPPVEPGAVHASATWRSPRVAVRPVGAPGVVAGVAETGVDAAPVPITFVAVTVKLYEVPFVSPPMVQPGVEVVQVAPPGLAVAV